MNGALILLLIIAGLYVAMNVVRLARGRRWAYSVCQVAKEWEQREHDKRATARAQATTSGAAPDMRRS